MMTGEKSFTDVVLICAEGEELAAHRVVLSAKSSYFKQMFLSDFKESITKQVDYSHIDKNIMQLILDFIYLNSLENVSKLSYSDLILLYQTSHMFELKELSEYCWDLVVKKIIVDNWLDAWNVVLLRGEESDICKVLHFIMMNLPTIIGREDFLGLSLCQMINFIEKINEFKFPTDDNLLEGIIRWSKKNEVEEKDINEMLQFINFDFISREYFSDFLERNEDLFSENLLKQFLKKLLLRLKSKTEIEIDVKEYNPVLKICFAVSLKIFIFSFDKNKNGWTYENVGLRIFDVSTKTLKCIYNLPFHLCDGIAPVQHGSNIYIVGGNPNFSSTRTYIHNFTQSFFVYDWKTNSVTMSLPSLPKIVTRNCHVCAVRDKIYVIDKDDLNRKAFLYFSINNHKWFEMPYPPRLNIIACVNINNVLHILNESSDDETYSLHTINNYVCEFCCNIPFKGNPISKKSVTVYKDKLYILTYEKNSRGHWYVFSPETKTWNIKNVAFPDGLYSELIFFSVADKYLMVYNQHTRILSRYNGKNKELEEVVTVIKPPSGKLPYYSALEKYEKMLIFTE